MLAGNIAGQTRTLPMAVYSEVAAGNMGSAFDYVIVIVFIAFIAIFNMDYVTIRKEKQWK
jgi:molybdate transport system permease protein